MKLLLENWNNYLNEEVNKTYYWQTNGPWKGEEIILGSTHVPKAIPRQKGRLEEIFEEVRLEKYPSRPSRLNCVYLCENIKGFSGKSFCSYPARYGGETYKVELRGDYNLFRANAEYFTEATFASDEENIRAWAEEYWKGDHITFLEVLVSPPQSAIIVKKLK